MNMNPNTTESMAKLGDFGLSQHVAPFVDKALETWSWMAPESFRQGSQYDERCDTYSFGIVTWEVTRRGFVLPSTLAWQNSPQLGTTHLNSAQLK